MSIKNFHTASTYVKAIIELDLSKDVLSRMVSELMTISDYDISSIPIEAFDKMPLLLETKNFLNILFKQKKADDLQGIASLLKLSFLKKYNIRFVKIYTSKELSVSEEAEILEELQNYFKTEVLLEKIVDSSLIGGFRLSFDSYLVDFSKKAKISKIKACILK